VTEREALAMVLRAALGYMQRREGDGMSVESSLIDQALPDMGRLAEAMDIISGAEPKP
jgi:hypothetical protein